MSPLLPAMNEVSRRTPELSHRPAALFPASRRVATRDEASPALVLACEDEYRVAFGDMLAAIHRPLRGKHERLRLQIANLGFNCERHDFARSD